CDC
ncbi:nucleotide sugar dehydrogenase family protein, partial [Vibrio parahaemolyticus EKP-021]